MPSQASEGPRCGGAPARRCSTIGGTMAKGGRKHYSKVVWPGFKAGPEQRHVAKIGRNDPCPCGSGRKYKECHADAGEAFLEKLARRADKERLRELRRELKEQGVPWYRRLFLRP